jgi:hypothetical protein
MIAGILFFILVSFISLFRAHPDQYYREKNNADRTTSGSPVCSITFLVRHGYPKQYESPEGGRLANKAPET